MFAVAGFIFSAQAQETRPKKDSGAYHHRNMMLKDLNLTDAQKTQLKAERESFKAQLDALEKNETLTVKEYKTRKADLYKQQKEKMNSLLTEDQKAALAKHKLERKGKHEMHRGYGIEKMKSQLNLSDDQVSKMKEKREAQKAAAKSIKEDAKLSSTEKAEKLKELKEQNKAAFKEILTEEQLQKMKEWKKDKSRK